jgi:hypothetical protein
VSIEAPGAVMIGGMQTRRRRYGSARWLLQAAAIAALLPVSLPCRAAGIPPGSTSAGTAPVTEARPPDCLRAVAYTVPLGTDITVRLKDGRRLTAPVETIDLGADRITLGGSAGSRTSPLTLAPLDIASIHYTTPGPVRPGYVIAGFLVGGTFGSAIGMSLKTPSRREVENGQAPYGGGSSLGRQLFGMALGGALGMAVGAISSMAVTVSHDISCR